MKLEVLKKEHIEIIVIRFADAKYNGTHCAGRQTRLANL